MTKEKQKKVCTVCGGTGQVSFFKGESRFLLTHEECEHCAGTGYDLDSSSGNKDGAGKGVAGKKGSRE